MLRHLHVRPTLMSAVVVLGMTKRGAQVFGCQVRFDICCHGMISMTRKCAQAFGCQVRCGVQSMTTNLLQCLRSIMIIFKAVKGTKSMKCIASKFIDTSGLKENQLICTFCPCSTKEVCQGSVQGGSGHFITTVPIMGRLNKLPMVPEEYPYAISSTLN